MGIRVLIYSFTTKFFHVMDKALSGELSCMQRGLVSSLAHNYRKSCYTHK